MPSLARIYQLTQSLLYHIYSRGNAKKEIFHCEEDYKHFIRILIAYSSQKNLKIYHWVIMPNHYHLIMEFDNPKEISSVMAGIGRAYVHYYHRKYQSAGHLFQGRFKSQPIEKESYLLACGRYIERNAVVAGLSSTAQNYAFSSAAFYVNGMDDLLTKEDPLFSSFGEALSERREKYSEFLRSFNQQEESLFDALEHPCGSMEFKSRLIKERGIFLPRNGRPRRKV